MAVALCSRSKTPIARSMANAVHSFFYMYRSTSTASNSNEKDVTNCSSVLPAASSSIMEYTTRGYLTSLEQVYEQQVSRGMILFDKQQHRAAKKLTRLQMALNEYDHAAFLEELMFFEQKNELEKQQQMNMGKEMAQSIANQPQHPSQTIPIPRGFYIHGSVGTGKSLLLNNFYNTAIMHKPNKKQRMHFHSFLQDIHQRIHNRNKQLLEMHGRSFHVDTSKQRNPIIHVAEELANEVTLLCIDEFQVTDIADAMILSQFFGELWKRGVVVVATSNRHPQKLYEGGVNRGYFLPFIEMLQKYCSVYYLGEDNTVENTGVEKDYRRIRSGLHLSGGDKACGDYFYLLAPEESDQQCSYHKMERLFHSLCKHSQFASNNQPLNLAVKFNRAICIPRHHSNVIARFTFDELCSTELGSSDYHTIANYFQIILIENIPHLTLKSPDKARRFITLVDELYEAGCCLACSAADIPDKLFVGKSTSSHDVVDVSQDLGEPMSDMASVKELSFAFGRAASRLIEMCSSTWWNERVAHLQEGEGVLGKGRQ